MSLTSIRALSLWQPYASFVALRLKANETRGWSTEYRGPLLIHAAKQWTGRQQDALGHLRRTHDVIDAAWIKAAREASTPTPPLGAVVAVAQLVDVRRMTEEWIAQQTDLERDVGEWAPLTRYGWVLSCVTPLSKPAPLVGSQGLFNVSRAKFSPEAWEEIVAAVTTCRNEGPCLKGAP